MSRQLREGSECVPVSRTLLSFQLSVALDLSSSRREGILIFKSRVKRSQPLSALKSGSRRVLSNELVEWVALMGS